MLDKQTAYTKWLGIKVQDQPPTLYRLLGVDALESDADAISYAADSRMALLRQFQIGDNAPLAEEILNELSKARVVLLNAEKKSAYDAWLRQRIAAQSAAAGAANVPTGPAVSPLRRAEAIAVPVRTSQPSAASPILDLDALTSEVRSTNSASHGRPKKKSNSLVWIAAAAGVALVIVAIVVVNSLSGGDDSSTKDTPKIVAVKPETPKPPAHLVAPEPSISPKSLDKSPKVEPDHAVAPTVEPPTPTPTPPPVAVAHSDPSSPDSEKPTTSPPAEPPKAPDDTAPAPTEPALIPTPDASAQVAATKLVKEVYGKEIAAAKTVDQKQALAKTLLEKAMESEKDRVSQFVLFRLAKEIAEQASDCQTAFDSIEETDKVFQIDTLEMKVDALKKCALAAATAEQQAALVERADQVCDQAVAKDNFVVAKPMMDLALAEAKKSKDESLVRESTGRKADIEKAAHAYVLAKSAISTLQKTPLDAEANLAVGKYNCFVKGDWQSGLPKLALGNDPALKALAESDLKGGAPSEEQVKLGDAWWNAAEGQKGADKKQVQRRAGFWYQQAWPGLSGLAKDRVESRFQKLREDLPVFLADLPAEEVRVLGGEPGTIFNEKRVVHAIWGHPPGDNSSSHSAYELEGRFKTLHGAAGIGSKAKNLTRTPLVFRIVGDGRLLWQGGPLKDADMPLPFRVNVAKVKKLELFVDCPGQLYAAHGMWIDPILER